MEQLISNLLTDLVKLIVFAGGTFVIPFLYHKIGEAKMNKISGFAGILVNAAEQIWKNENKAGESKKEYVVEMLTKKFKISEELADAIVEAAVKETQSLIKAQSIDLPQTVKLKSEVNVLGEAKTSDVAQAVSETVTQ